MPKQHQRKRVLLMAAHLPDGGINTHMLTLGTELRRLGWVVAICSGGPLRLGRTADGMPSSDRGHAAGVFPPVVDHYEHSGIEHINVSIPNRPQRLRELPRLLLFPLAAWQVLRAVTRLRPMVLHSHTRQMGVYARLVQLLTGVPFITTMHNPVIPTSRLFAKTTLFGAAAIGVSEEIRNILIEGYGVDPARARLVVPGVDARRFRAPNTQERKLARERYGLGSEQFAVAFVGSLVPRKRPDTLIEAVAEVVGAGHDVVALVAGRGSEEEALRELTSSLRIEHAVRFLGYQDSRDVLWATDALALSSESEGSPLVVAEAMLSGVVVLSTPVGGVVQQIRPDVSGLTFEYGDHRALARAMHRMIEEPELRTSLATAALEDARERYSSARMAQTIEGIYLEVAGALRR